MTKAEKEVEAIMGRMLATGITIGWGLAKLPDELAPKVAGISDPKEVERLLQAAINRIITAAGLDDVPPKGKRHKA